MNQVDPTVTLREVQKDPRPYIGKMVLWGGVIVETTTKKEETIIQLRQTGLDYQKRPTNPDASLGRFLVRYPGFLDPAIFKAGREITVAGEVVGKDVLPLGEIQYGYPVILAKEIHLWPREEYLPYPYYYDRYPYWWYGPPYWWHGPYRYW